MMFPCIRGGDRRVFSMKFLGFASSFDQATQFSFLPPRATQTQGGAGDLYGPGSVASLPDTKYHLQQTSWDLSVWVPKMVPFNGWKKSASLSKFNWHPRKEGANDGSRNWPWKQAICPPNSCWNWRVVCTFGVENQSTCTDPGFEIMRKHLFCDTSRLCL